MPAGKLHGFDLELHQFAGDIVRNPKLLDAITRIFRQMPSHLQIDVMGRNQPLSGPALLDYGNQVFRNVQAAFVLPSIFEPLDKLPSGVFVEHVDI